MTEWTPPPGEPVGERADEPADEPPPPDTQGAYEQPPVMWPPPEPHPGPRSNRMVPLVVALVGAALVVCVAVGLPLALRSSEAGDPAQTGTRTGVAIDGLDIYEDLRTDHVDEDVDYAQTPPAGGPHDPAWLACGVYDDPVRDENAVHDLEHGAVWISYDPALSDDDVDALATALPDNGIMAPYPDLPAPVVLTVWGRQLALDGIDDARLGQFLGQFGAGEASLEPFASCQGGITDPGGDPAEPGTPA